MSSTEIKPRMRGVVSDDYNAAAHAALDQLRQVLYKEVKQHALHQTCLTCHNFDEQNELCKKFNMRPPARVIAFSCKDYDDIDEIPF